jgi:hypothetical protein
MTWLDANWHLIELLLVVGSVAGGWFAMRADIRVVQHDMENVIMRQDAIAETMKTLSDLMTTVAVQDQRINRVEDDIVDLKHGRGLVK